MKKWSEEELMKHNAMRLKKMKCPNCGLIVPIMELINTAGCLNCHTYNEIIENEFFIISKDDLAVLDEEK